MNWQPIETAPKDGTYIIVAGPSGYVTTPLRAEICRYDAEYRPYSPWVTHGNDCFTDGGVPPTLWVPIPGSVEDGFTYASKQSTNCAVCGQRKHTPLRNDAMGGYVCLTCIDRELVRLHKEMKK